MLDSSPEDEDFPGRLLHQAALWDNAELLEDLLHGDQLSLINSQDSWGRTPLHAAAITENSRCLSILLASGGNPDIQCGPRGESKTALHLSAEHGHDDNVKTLLEHEASMLVRDANGMTAYDIADQCGHKGCMVLLREAADAREKLRQDAHAALREACGVQEDVSLVKRIISGLPSGDAGLVVNMAPGGANTLLFLACQTGRKEMVKVLLDSGADGRCHPVTRYSPLYISCYHGHKDIVELLLSRFPELVQLHTVERWLPIHACCINGHYSVLELLFQYPYPARLLRTFEAELPGGTRRLYRMPFDANELDVTGQSVLYVACLLGNSRTAETILALRSPALPEEDEDETSEDCPETPVDEDRQPPMSPTRRRISHGIQSIMSKLSLSRGNSAESDVGSASQSPPPDELCPVKLDQYCNNGTETALHAAVKGRHYGLVQLLLKSGASPNLSIRADDVSASSADDEFCTGKSTALVEACRNRDVPMAELLLSHGARDDECRALCVAVRNRDEVLTARLLSIKANPDPEHKINKRAMTEETAAGAFSQLASSVLANFTTTYSSMFPSQPVMVNWHNQRCHLSQVRPQWLTDAALHLNPRLKQNPRCHDLALYAITRLDISSNSLVALPPEVFQLASLRHLNVAQNKIEHLPEPANKERGRRSRSVDSARGEYRCPALEELYLQDNRLEEVPEALFRLPSLVTLVVSNNKLQRLPYEMWRAPKLKELNVSFNLLRELPAEEARGSRPLSAVSPAAHVAAPMKEEFGECETPRDDAPGVRLAKRDRCVVQLEPERHHLWCRSVEVTEQIMHAADEEEEDKGKSLGGGRKVSQLSSLNLAHNMFTSVPAPLACLAVNLTRLNMSFNSLRSMSHITSYPGTLKQLDLSHNQIACWPSLPQVPRGSSQGAADPSVACYATTSTPIPARPVPACGPGGRPPSVRSAVLQSVCAHRRHLRLDGLRTLVLAGNKLARIQLATDDDGCDEETERDQNEPEWTNVSAVAAAAAESHPHQRTRLMFPNLSMLDASDNGLREVPAGIHELSNLSVLNVSGNADIAELPPQMGLLSRLWNLNTRGCSLHEPLRSMIESKKYKTMDVVGYLKSVLEDARPYARMKLMIVGVQGIGKTSLLEQLRQEGGTSRHVQSSVHLEEGSHWAKRMGNQSSNQSQSGKTSRGVNISTVGVDIGDWVYERRGGARGSSHGPVVFRTWDFGGQREYYATHQYFLSKRSLYLVVWRILDGERGISEILQWLVNIQARAPNSPVLIVGTHYDLAQERLPTHRCEQLQQGIRDRFINIVDAEKCGLPRVLDTIEVSCKTRHNVRLLCNLIYETAFSLRPPGSKEPLLEQRVPASYLALEDVVGAAASRRRQAGLDPVLAADEYRAVVSAEMHARYGRSFRDQAELHQATLFLHDNGVLLHYDDATLKDLYFLDPQWLCDMLAHVVTIREINPFARGGVMRLEDLRHVFKASGALGPVDHGRGYIVSLLNKFEVALTWDSRTLLIPSLLPTEEEAARGGGSCPGPVKVRVPVRSRGRAVRGKKHVTVSPRSLQYPDPGPGVEETIKVGKKSAGAERAVTRLLLMSYFPSGFWSRLVSRILADDNIVDIVRSYFAPPKEAQDPAAARALLELRAEWLLWQTGLQLRYGEVTLFRMREVPRDSQPFSAFSSNVNYRQLRFRLRQDGVWCDVDLAGSSILEMHFPMDALTVGDLEVPATPESATQLLALAVDHIDILLEDWYPTLGTRFVHTSEGRFLVTRLVPCPSCLAVGQVEREESGEDREEPETDGRSLYEALTRRARKSQESYTSEADSGVGGESAGSSRVPSVEGRSLDPGSREDTDRRIHYGWMVEECILAAHGNEKGVQCPTHGLIPLSHIAPDVAFMDLGERHLIKPESVKRGRLLGRGAFGFVFRGTCRSRGSQAVVDVAMKMLQPVQPGAGARQSAVVAYRAAQGKWERDPLQYACKAYCTARQELGILLALRHPNIVPLVGVCASPLAIVLDLAPRGALDACLRHYRRSGARLSAGPLRQLILQTARAIEYLHRQRIIYRDLKSENVLVWKLPEPFSGPEPDQPQDDGSSTHVKLADYGISRMTLPGGAKGFGGTEGFMAPEIMRHNGEEEYTEKVDCFSFGMFVYELLTLRQPFEGHESVKECILEGGRPPLARRQTLVHPPHALDLMVLCWAQGPRDRPSASQIVSIASAPEFARLADVVSLKHSAAVTAATAGPPLVGIPTAGTGKELWLACSNSRVDLLLAGGERGSFLQYHSFATAHRPTSICRAGEAIWIGDCSGNVQVHAASDAARLLVSKVSDGEVEIRCLIHVPRMGLVACVLGEDKPILLDSTDAKVSSELEPLTEEKFIIHALCVVQLPDGRSELWAGCSKGRLSVYELGKDESPIVLDHHEQATVLQDGAAVLSLVTDGGGEDCDGGVSSTSVWTYVYPGCVVYQWDVATRRVVNRLDCSKLVPCSESLKSIAIEEHLSPGRCQVTGLAVARSDLYIGTTWGCLIVAERATMRPVTVFRPYEEDVRAVVPLGGGDKAPLVATVGRGYRSLLARYADRTPPEPERRQDGMFALLWRADNWAAV